MIRINIRKKLNTGGPSPGLIIDTEIADHSFTALYGPSGAGKTSILRILTGLMQPEEGMIEVDGETWFNSQRKINLPPQKRNAGLVFQDYALFPNMSVKENLLFASAQKDAELLQQMLRITGLTEFQDQKPHLLSGGQKQRVALARALMRKPALLLLDEPLSALDQQTRIQLRQELRQLHQENNLTTLLVSHDKPEIYTLADQVISIDKGTIIRSGTFAEVFGSAPSNALTLRGEVLRINQTLTNYTADILTGDQIMTIPLTRDLAKTLVPGEKVTLTFQLDGTVIQKLS